MNNTQDLPEIEYLDLNDEVPASIYEACKNECNNSFRDFVQRNLVQIGLNMQLFKPHFNQLRGTNGEETLRDIIVVASKQYFGKQVNAEIYQNGRTDIKFTRFENSSGSLIVECLRDDTYPGVKYKKKINQVFGYTDIDESIFLLTFVQTKTIEGVIANAKIQASSLEFNLIPPIKDIRLNTNNNYRHGFVSVHSVPPKNISVIHLFYDLKIIGS